MNSICLSLVIFHCVVSSMAAPLPSSKGSGNATTIEDELHTLISSKAAEKNETKSKVGALPTGKKLELKDIIDSIPNIHKELPDQLLIPKEAERTAVGLVKRNLPKAMKQRDIMKNLYRDISGEEINDYERADEWSLDTPEDTSRDMAEYIFWTGDEVSVTQAVKDFMKQGMLTQNEAIVFLEDVRNHLKKMQIRYGIAGSGSHGEEVKRIPDYSAEERAKLSSQTDFKEASEVADNQLAPGDILDEELGHSDLRDMLYEMGKIFFKQSIVKDGPRDTEEALHNLATYLDAESEMGRISETTKAQILEVLFTSLVDAMNDNSEMDHTKSKGRHE